MLRRATTLVSRESTLEDAVRGAVLATDALELLGGRTPTLSIDALRLKHSFEVRAECLFSGVEHHIALKERIDEIKRDVKHICAWFGKTNEGPAALNAEMQILLDIVAVLRQHNQFDEEEICLNRTREIQRLIWRIRFKRSPWRPLAWAIQPAWRYVNWLLGGPMHFAGSLAILLVLGWALLASTQPEGFNQSNLQHAFNALFTFSPLEQDPKFGGPYRFLHNCGITLGILHLGVFISRLYTWISRK